MVAIEGILAVDWSMKFDDDVTWAAWAQVGEEVAVVGDPSLALVQVIVGGERMHPLMSRVSRSVTYKG